MGSVRDALFMEEPISPMKMGWRISLILSFLAFEIISDEFFIFKN